MTTQDREELRDYSQCLQQKVHDGSEDLVDKGLGRIGALIEQLLKETEG